MANFIIVFLAVSLIAAIGFIVTLTFRYATFKVEELNKSALTAQRLNDALAALNLANQQIQMLVDTKSPQDLIELCFNESKANGWWDNDKRNKGEMIALIHSEISECLEGVRKNCQDDKLPARKMEEVELADAVIRIFDYAYGWNLDILGAMYEKIVYNRNREDHKRENRDKEGGKKF